MAFGKPESINVDDRSSRDFPPGTEFMHEKNDDLIRHILIPTPSDDPHDPLNWTTFWKSSAMFATTFVTFTQGIGPTSLAPMLEYYVEDFSCTLAQAVQFTGITVLILGFSNFLWVPMSKSLGRRPVFILSQLLGIAAAIWRAKATTYESFLGASALSGVASGPSEAIQPEVIVDIYFLGDRGTWNTLFWTAWATPLLIGPVIAGAMSLHIGWRSFWWFNVGMLGLSLIIVVFMFPETRYNRPNPANNVHVESLDATKGSEDRFVQLLKSEHVNNNKDYCPRTHLGKGHPSRSQWNFCTIYGKAPRDFISAFITPWKMLLFPIVSWAGMIEAWACGSFLLVNVTQTQVFGAKPYNFTSQSIGFTNFAMLVGVFIGFATAGPASDWILTRTTRKNHGVREPESRLLVLVPYALIMILGNVVIAVGYQNSWPWESIVIIGYACIGIQVASLPAIATTYAVDSYKPAAGSVFVATSVYKNLWSYGLSRFITPWTMEAGFVTPIMTNMALFVLWCLFGILFYLKGKRFRQWSRHSNVHSP